MEFDYSKLKGRIIEKMGKQEAFAEALGLTKQALSTKLNNRYGFKQKEIMKAKELLDIDDVTPYFFENKVEK